MTDNIKTPPKLAATRGRPGVDWMQLYSDWLKSGQTKRDFLAEYGFKTTSSQVKKIIKAWTKDEQSSRDAMGKLLKQHRTDVQHTADLWQVVQQWRQKQAADDWKMADAIRNHAKLILNRSIKTDETGQTMSTLSPNQLVALADAMGKVQKMQRLALGMSTDNVGVETTVKDETHVEQQPKDDDGHPVFIVEVNQNGKFVRPRPRRVQ